MSSLPFSLNSKRKKILLWTVPTLILVIGAIGMAVAAYDASIPNLTSLLPTDTQLVTEADMSWWLKASEPVRQQPGVASALAQAEKQSGLSFKDDIEPWAGQVAVGVMRISPKFPQVAVCAEVRDMPAFLRTLARIKFAATTSAKLKWSTETYQGVELQTAQIPIGPGQSWPIKIGFLHGWMVAGIGAKATEKVIDSYQGRAPSLASNSRWSAALSHLPQNPVSWTGVDYGPFMTSLMAMGAVNQSAMPEYYRQMKQLMVVVSLSDLGKGLRLDSVAIPTSDMALNRMRAYSAIGPVTGKVLSRLPNHTNIAMLINNPAFYYKFYYNLMMTQLQQISQTAKLTNHERRAQKKQARMMAPLNAAIATLKGEFGLGLTWQDGMGGIATAHATSAIAARRAAAVLATFARQNKVKVHLGGGTYALAKSPGDPSSAFFAPCWRANGEWLELATNPGLFHAPRNSPTLRQLPESVGAITLTMGNFHGLSDTLGMFLGMSGEGSTGKQAMAAVHGLVLDNATWCGWTSYHDKGTWAQSSFVINDWDWRQAVANEAEIVTKMVNDHQNAKPGSPTSDLSLARPSHAAVMAALVKLSRK